MVNYCPLCGLPKDIYAGGRVPTTRIKVFNLLRDNKGRWFKGEELAERFGVSRANIGMQIHRIRQELQELRSDIYIDGHRRLGYCYKVRGDNAVDN